MKSSIYLLAAIVLLAASCGDSGNEGPELLFVQTSDGATLTDSTLTLTGISPNTGWFTDRPYRGAGQIPTEEFVALWGDGENSFAEDPPNADFTCTVDGQVVNYVVELTYPQLDGEELTYGARAIGDAEVTSQIQCQDPAIFLDSLVLDRNLGYFNCGPYSDITTPVGLASHIKCIGQSAWNFLRQRGMT